MKILTVITVFIICFSKLMSQGARRDEANEGFGYRYDDELLTSVNNAGNAALTYEVNASNCQGFYSEMTVGFKPLRGLFSQFKYLVIDPNKYDESDTGLDEGIRTRFTVVVAGDTGKATNTSIDLEISNPRVVCDVCALDNNLNNEYTKHLLEGKGLPITYTTYITQSQTVKGSTDISVPVIRSVSKTCCFICHFLQEWRPKHRIRICGQRILSVLPSSSKP